MFNFVNLDDVEEGGATAEWQKTSGTPEWQRVPEEPKAKLMDQWEEVQAAGDDNFEAKQIVVQLPKDSWDPLGLGLAEDSNRETNELIQMHGDVGMNLSVSVTTMRDDFEKSQRKELAHAQYEERLLALERIDQRKTANRLQKSAQFAWEGSKKFEWRQIYNQLIASMFPLPEGGMATEVGISKGVMERSGYAKVGKFFLLPGATLVSIIAGATNQACPEPAGGRRGKADNYHIDLNEVIFPSAMVVEDGEALLEGLKKAKGDTSWLPNVSCMVVYNCSKQPGVKEPRPHWGKMEYGK